jgi:hypothetical protein
MLLAPSHFERDYRAAVLEISEFQRVRGTIHTILKCTFADPGRKIVAPEGKRDPQEHETI